MRIAPPRESSRDILPAAPESRFAALFGSFADALGWRAPVEVEGTHDRDRRAILYRSILLPFVDLDGSPAYVLGGFASSAES
jgi:hypothetical protein